MTSDALRAAGNLIGADARAGNGRWTRVVFHLDKDGFAWGRELEID